MQRATQARSFRSALDRVTGLTLGLLITLTFAIGLQNTLPDRTTAPSLFQALHVDYVRAFARAEPQPSVSKIETVVVGGESVLGPRALLARWQPLMEEASKRFSVPVDWIRAVMRAESGGRTELAGRPIVSRAGALGLMQLLPETYRDMQVRYRLGPDIADPRDNIMAGAAYLHLLHKRYGFPSLFAAYNAGPAQFDRDVATGHSLPAETRAYVSGIAGADSLASLESGFTLPRDVGGVRVGSWESRQSGFGSEQDLGNVRVGSWASVQSGFVGERVSGKKVFVFRLLRRTAQRGQSRISHAYAG